MGIQKSIKGIEYIDVKLTRPWMGRRPAYADNEMLFVMPLELEATLDKGYLTEPVTMQFIENGIPLPGKTRIRARENVWRMYGEDDSIQYRIHKTDAGLEVHNTVVDMEATNVIPMTRLMAEKLIGRKTAIPNKRKKKRAEEEKATEAPANKKAVAINSK